MVVLLVVLESPVLGLHEYVVAPPAVRVTLFPEHIELDAGVAVNAGRAFTVTITV